MVNFPSWTVKIGSLTLNRRGISVIALLLIFFILFRWISVWRVSFYDNDFSKNKYLMKQNGVVCMDAYISSLQSQLNNRLVSFDSDLKDAAQVIGTGFVLADIKSKRIHLRASVSSLFDDTVPWYNFLTPLHTVIVSDTLFDLDSGLLRRVSVLDTDPSCVIMDEKFFANANNGHAVVQDITIINNNPTDAYHVLFDKIPLGDNGNAKIEDWAYATSHEVVDTVPSGSQASFRSVVAFRRRTLDKDNTNSRRSLLSFKEDLQDILAQEDEPSINTAAGRLRRGKRDVEGVDDDAVGENSNSFNERRNDEVLKDENRDSVEVMDGDKVLSNRRLRKRHRRRQRHNHAHQHSADSTEQEQQVRQNTSVASQESTVKESLAAVPTQSISTEVDYRDHEELYHSYSAFSVSSQGPFSSLHSYFQYLFAQSLPVSKLPVAPNTFDGCFNGHVHWIDHESAPSSINDVVSFTSKWNNVFSAHGCASIFTESGGVVALQQYAKAVMGMEMMANSEVKVSPGWRLHEGALLSSRHVLWSQFDVSITLRRFTTTIKRLDRSSEPLYVHERDKTVTLLAVNQDVTLPSDTLFLSPSKQSVFEESQFGDDRQRPLSHNPSTSTSLVVFLFVAIAGFHVVLIRMVYKEYCVQ
eukprot:m.52317 g.52317  ORF g.52317 m.52317 type:complete len:640 (+) comp10990_c0_seq2:68-1987(+)